MWPWAERGSRFQCGLFTFVKSATRPKLPLNQIVIGTLNHATCDVYSPKAVGTLIFGENVTEIVFIIVFNIIICSFHYDSKSILNTLKKVLPVRQPWNALTLQLSLSL